MQPYKLALDRDIDKSALAVTYPEYQLPNVILITGGTGFLGTNIVRALEKQKGVKKIIAFDLVERKISDDPRVMVVAGNLLDSAMLRDTLTKHGVGCVIHTASPHPNADAAVLHKVNVQGTEAVIAACRAAGVHNLVATSSASVVWEGTPHAGVDESVPYPSWYRDVYAETKAMAEQAVMRAGKEQGKDIITIALRPHAIFGPEDRQMVPTLVEVAKAKKNKIIIGDGTNLVDHTYIGNVVHSHLLAAQTAHSYWSKNGTGVGCPANGKTYFITNGEPRPIWDVLNGFWLGLGYDSAYLRLPYRVALYLSFIAQAGASLASLIRGKKVEITFSPSRMQIVGTEHYYNISAAKKDIGYTPLWNMDQGIYLALLSFAALRNKTPSRLTVSKARDGNLVALGLVKDIYLHEQRMASKANKGPVDPSNLREISAEEVSKHTYEDDLWVVIKGLVYDLTEYVDMHPGGLDILKHAGGDATEGFNGPQHPASVQDTVQKFLIGRLKK